MTAKEIEAGAGNLAGFFINLTSFRSSQKTQLATVYLRGLLPMQPPPIAA